MINVSTAVKVRPFSCDLLDAVLELQNMCEHGPAWGRRDYEQLANDPRGMILVAELENRPTPELLGFSAAYWLGEEAELWSIGVAPRHRRQGVARSLLQEVCRIMAGCGVQRLLLEVRRSNIPAMELYHSLGFALLLTRKGYYQNPSEDALVLVRKLVPSDA